MVQEPEFTQRKKIDLSIDHVTDKQQDLLLQAVTWILKLNP